MERDFSFLDVIYNCTNRHDYSLFCDMEKMILGIVDDACLFLCERYPDFAPKKATSFFDAGRITDLLSKREDLSFAFMKKYADELNWEDILQFNKNIDEEFIKEFSEFIDWHRISDNKNLNHDFIDRHFKELSPYSLIVHQTMPDDLLWKYRDELNWKNVIRSNPTLSEEFIERFKDYIDWDMLFEEIKSDIPTGTYASSDNADFWLKYGDRIGWYRIWRYVNFEDKVIMKLKGKINWELVSKYQKLISESFMERFKDKLNWHWIFVNHSLSDDFKKKYNSFAKS